MASTQSPSLQQNNVGQHAPKTKLFQSGLTRQEDSNGRKTLQTIQLSSLKDKGSDQISKEKKQHIQKIGGNKPTVTVFADPVLTSSPLKSFDNKAVQTEGKIKPRILSCDSDIDQEAYDLMVNEEIPETYWKVLAEERRQALNESLHENESLHKEIDELKEENAKLSQLASQTEYFANVIKDILGDEDKEEKSNENEIDSCEEHCNDDKILSEQTGDSNCDIKEIVKSDENEICSKGDNSEQVTENNTEQKENPENENNKSDDSQTETVEQQQKDDQNS